MPERIAVDHHEVGQLAVLQRAELLLEPQGQRAFRRRKPQDLVVRNACRCDQCELVVDA